MCVGGGVAGGSQIFEHFVPVLFLCILIGIIMPTGMCFVVILCHIKVDELI